MVVGRKVPPTRAPTEISWKETDISRNLRAESATKPEEPEPAGRPPLVVGRSNPSLHLHPSVAPGSPTLPNNLLCFPRRGVKDGRPGSPRGWKYGGLSGPAGTCWLSLGEGPVLIHHLGGGRRHGEAHTLREGRGQVLQEHGAKPKQMAGNKDNHQHLWYKSTL